VAVVTDWTIQIWTGVSASGAAPNYPWGFLALSCIF